MRLGHRTPWTRERIFTRSEPEPNSGCWLWTGVLNSHGYGSIRFGPKKHVPAFHVSYALSGRTIPDGEVLDHWCNTRVCVNPDHLRPITRVENVMRGDGLCARKARQTQCKRGHPLSGDNLIVYPSAPTQRACRECKRVNLNAYKKRQRAAARALREQERANGA